MADHIGMIAAQSNALRNGLEYVYGTGVPGDIIEFGCYLGRTASILAQGMKEFDWTYKASDMVHSIKERRLFVFDSFEGFPVASDPIDVEAPQIKSGAWQAGTPRGATPQDIANICGRSITLDRIMVGAGWFKDTLSLIPEDTKFGFVHIDCDYYESAYQVLDYLFTKGMFSDGCALYFDDWYCNRGSPQYGEQKAFADVRAKHGIGSDRVSDWGSYGIVGHRFIVHG